MSKTDIHSGKPTPTKTSGFYKKGMVIKMITFVAGMMCGGFVGVLTLALFIGGKDNQS